jgi:outer membrane receptor protein involved in Fe transport
VQDKAGAVVPDAPVTLRAENLSRSTLSGPSGEFSFDDITPASGTVHVTARGFAAQDVDWHHAPGQDARVVIILTPAAPGEQVTVSASRTETELAETPASVVVVTGQRLASTGALMLDDALRQVPGFSLFRRSSSRTANPTTQGVSLRGVGASGASRALVMVDGVPLNDPFGSWVYWDRVPRTSVESIELLRGGVSSLYGNDALGGAIDVLTSHPESPALTLETSYGNEQTPDLALTAGGRHGPWGASISGEAFRTSGFVLVDDADRGTIDTKASSEFLNGSLTLDRRLGKTGRVFVTGSLFGESRHNGTPFQTNNTRYNQLVAGADWQMPIGAFTVRAFGASEIFNQTFSSIASDRDSETPTRIQRVPSVPLGFSAQWSKPVAARQTLVAGFDAIDVRGHSNEIGFKSGVPSTLNDNGGRQRTLSVFGEDIIRIAARWQLTVNARMDHWRNFDALTSTQPIDTPPPVVTRFTDRSETAFTPRLALLYRANNALSFTASAYRSFRAPTLNELYRGFRQGNVMTLANPDLKAERLTGGELGTLISAFNQRLFLRGTFFWSEVARPVANVTISDTPSLITRMRENLGSTRSRGIEIEGEGRILPNFTLSGGYQFVAATVLDFAADPTMVGLDIPQIPRHQFTFQAAYTPQRWVFSVQGRAIGSQFDDDQNLLPLDPFFSLDLLVSHPLGHGIDMFGAFENLTDQRYQVARTPITTLGPPILARVGLRVHLSRR